MAEPGQAGTLKCHAGQADQPSETSRTAEQAQWRSLARRARSSATPGRTADPGEPSRGAGSHAGPGGRDWSGKPGRVESAGGGAARASDGLGG
jgi:hypothetical protein